MSAIASLNAPFGARCFLTRAIRRRNGQRSVRSLNPPFGARCFLTPINLGELALRVGLNAPFGARCFLTPSQDPLCNKHPLS